MAWLAAASDVRLVDYARDGDDTLIRVEAARLGEAAPESWRAIDLSAHAVKGEVVGTLARDGVGANVLGDPRIALAWLASHYGGWGATLWAMLAFAAGGALCGFALARIESTLGR